VTRPYTYSVATLQVCFKKEVLWRNFRT
jgi:hypothetical protein